MKCLWRTKRRREMVGIGKVGRQELRFLEGASGKGESAVQVEGGTLGLEQRRKKGEKKQVTGGGGGMADAGFGKERTLRTYAKGARGRSSGR